MTESTFSRVEKTDKRLYGPRKLIVCGYAAEDRPALRALVDGLEIDDLPLVFAATARARAGAISLARLITGLVVVNIRKSFWLRGTTAALNVSVVGSVNVGSTPMCSNTVAIISRVSRTRSS